MRKSLRFFREYCRNVKEIGSIVPDSRSCVNSLLRMAPFATAKVIVEFGAASGAVTREIIRRKRPGTIFISFEKNPRLHGPLEASTKGENVFLVNEDVFNCPKVLADVFGILEKGVDCIVSTLPCSCMDFDGLLRHSVLPVLKDNGHFIQYTHTLTLLKGFNLKRFLGKHFATLHSDLVLFNIPPALVYTCLRAPRIASWNSSARG
ncbi:MAG: class I SAM-dependent methyltransferase [Candidatus Brocadiia bacterium]